jgi:hypothetical protein
MITVHLRINDEANGKPTPVRLRVTGPDGTYHAPFGRLAEFATGKNEDVGGNLRLGRENWCYIDGVCEIRLPTGVPLRVRATKGPEYEPLDREVTLGAGQMALRLAVRRWSNLAAEGWYSGDARAHFIPPHAALLEAAAEDVSVVNLLGCPQPLPSLDGMAYPSIPNMSAFSGQSPALEADGRLVVVNTLNAHPVLGRVGLLNCHRAVFPLASGGDEPDDWSVTDWCRQCHRKAGLAVWVDAFRTETGGEALAAAVLGQLDAIEIDAHPRPPLLPWWYRMLNAGIRLPLVGGSGKESNRVPIGAVRTYARLCPGEPLSYKAWIEAVRAGRTFVTNGPLLKFDVSEAEDGKPVRISAEANSLSPFERLEIVLGGRAVATAPAALTEGRYSARSEILQAAADPCWVAARCLGGSGTFAHTSPGFVSVSGRPFPRDPDAIAALRRRLERTREWLDQHGRFTEEKWKRHLLEICNQSLARLGVISSGLPG